MLIAGIRHKISSELDVHRSATFMRYLLHYLAMFAFLGVIIPMLIGVDYFCNLQTENDVITKKQEHVVNDMNHVEYRISTKSRKFLSDVVFYENIRIGSQVVFLSTPIFSTITNVSFRTEKGVYKCDPNSVYSWMLIIMGVTFIISIIFVLEIQNSMRRYKHVKYNSVINMGIFNAFLSIFTIVAVMFHILY